MFIDTILEHFSNFDYGAVGNIAHYNSVNVPEYNVSKVTAPAIILYSKQDNIVTPKVRKRRCYYLGTSELPKLWEL